MTIKHGKIFAVVWDDEKSEEELRHDMINFLKKYFDHEINTAKVIITKRLEWIKMIQS